MGVSKTALSRRRRALVINDLAGHSHTSLMAVIPIMQTMGIGVTALPTALLSSNTELEGFKLIELTERLEGFLQHWQKLGLSFDAIYSGFLSSSRQVSLVLKALKLFAQPQTLIVVDPVMADNGELYPCFRQDIVREMRSLVQRADIITPNLTEAALLLGEEYQAELETEQVKNMCRRLAELGPGKVVITSYFKPGRQDKTCVIAYDSEAKSFHLRSCSYLPVNYPGSGDIFTALLTALLLNGMELFPAIDTTVRFISRAMQLTLRLGTPAQEGICLEQALALLPRPRRTTLS
jgi:pyridoxine kinase